MVLIPKVSIITPVFNILLSNRKYFFLESFNSVLNQKFIEIEYIILDGYSNDGTQEYIKSLINNNNNINFISQKDNGVYDAMNKGLELASGDYIAFLNSDDYYLSSSSIRDSVEIILSSNSDFSYANTLGIDSISNKSLDIWQGDINNLPFGTYFCHQSVVYKTKKLIELSGFDLNYKISADSDLFIRSYKSLHKSCHLNKTIVAYRNGGLSNLNVNKVRAEHSKSFYQNIGRDQGLSFEECFEIWNYKIFEEKSLKYIFKINEKLEKINPHWTLKNKLIEKYHITDISIKSQVIFNLLKYSKKIITRILPSRSIIIKLIKRIIKF